ncbi:conserved protein of unknown function [Sterolibacterium denitrificans]|uniref:Uncharacterized protein n=2 Tax=Sterolibacterium denitrificans TaxID=157592 RepID=A0A656Z6P4_9PROT|nr:DUF1631 family protein [Sterolibacterium denitrificans]KYC28844.1 hypothetical protein ACY05_03965 [Sterolibacterium denitrificans]SMB21172.1 conserved protein of unknown function [Sterolibacterium denitrificans]
MTEITSSLAQRLLRDCRELLERDLGEWLDELGPQVAEKLQELADNTRELDKRTEYLRLRDEVQLFWDKLTTAFRGRLAWALEHVAPPAAAAAAAGDDAQPLALVDDQELTERIVTREFIARLSESCSEEMYALDRRVALLVGQEEMERCGNRFGPQAICAAAQAGCEAMLADPAARTLLLRQLERALHGELPLLYRALNEVLIGAGILPEFKRSYRHATVGSSAAADAGNILDTLQRLARARLPGLVAGVGSGSAALAGGMGADVAGTLGAAMPLSAGSPGVGAGTAAPLLPPGTIAVSADFLASLQALQMATPEDGAGTGTGTEPLTNVVRLARASAAAQQAAPLDSITMDIVATLFDLIFDDDKVPEAVKGLVSRLQIPVLKVALLDQKFFADRGHPARRFLDSISGIAIRWGGTIDMGDPFYGKLSELIGRIQNNFDQDVAVFGTAVAELSAFVNECEALEEETSNSVVEAVQRREAAQQRRLAREAAASQAAERVLAQVITKKTPLPIEQFLRGQWRAVLEHIGTADGADGGIDSPSFQAAERVAEELAWSVTPKRSTEDRQRFTALLPKLLPALHQGLDRIGIGADARKPLFDALITLHAAALHADRRALRKAPALEAEAVADEASTDAASVTLQVTHLVENGIQIEDVALVEPASALDSSLPGNPWLRRVRQMVRGDWVEFIDADASGRDGSEESDGCEGTSGAARRERLTWLSPQRTVYIFSNHATNCAISITPEALAHRLQNATARLVEHETPLFERALDGAIKALDQAVQE